MLKRIKSILFVVCAVMIFTAQTNRLDEKGKQQHAPSARPAPAVHNNQTRLQAVHRVAPPTAQPRTSQPSYQRKEAPQRRELLAFMPFPRPRL